MRRLCRHLLFCLLTALLLAGACAPTAAQGVDIRQIHIESSDDGYRLASSFGFELNRGLEDALLRGVALYFTTEVNLTRPRWYWFDENSLSATQTIRLSYNVLTRQYHVGINGGLQQSFQTLDDALTLVRRPSRWLVAEKGVLKPGDTYQGSIRMRLDVELLPKPFQVNALNNSDWRLSSDWKSFTYRAE